MSTIKTVDGATGVVTLEEYWKDGKRHREGDQPAVIVRDAPTGIVTFESYWKDDKLHRDDNEPALIIRDAETGIVISEEYYKNGEPIPAPAERPVHVEKNHPPAPKPI